MDPRSLIEVLRVAFSGEYKEAIKALEPYSQDPLAYYAKAYLEAINKDAETPYYSELLEFIRGLDKLGTDVITRRLLLRFYYYIKGLYYGELGDYLKASEYLLKASEELETEYEVPEESRRFFEARVEQSRAYSKGLHYLFKAAHSIVTGGSESNALNLLEMAEKELKKALENAKIIGYKAMLTFAIAYLDKTKKMRRLIEESGVEGIREEINVEIVALACGTYDGEPGRIVEELNDAISEKALRVLIKGIYAKRLGRLRAFDPDGKKILEGDVVVYTFDVKDLGRHSVLVFRSESLNVPARYVHHLIRPFTPFAHELSYEFNGKRYKFFEELASDLLSSHKIYSALFVNATFGPHRRILSVPLLESQDPPFHRLTEEFFNPGRPHDRLLMIFPDYSVYASAEPEYVKREFINVLIIALLLNSIVNAIHSRVIEISEKIRRKLVEGGESVILADMRTDALMLYSLLRYFEDKEIISYKQRHGNFEEINETIGTRAQMRYLHETFESIYDIVREIYEREERKMDTILNVLLGSVGLILGLSEISDRAGGLAFVINAILVGITALVSGIIGYLLVRRK